MHLSSAILFRIFTWSSLNNGPWPASLTATIAATASRFLAAAFLILSASCCLGVDILIFSLAVITENKNNDSLQTTTINLWKLFSRRPQVQEEQILTKGFFFSSRPQVQENEETAEKLLYQTSSSSSHSVSFSPDSTRVVHSAPRILTTKISRPLSRKISSEMILAENKVTCLSVTMSILTVATGITKVAKSPFTLHSHLLRKVVT